MLGDGLVKSGIDCVKDTCKTLILGGLKTAGLLVIDNSYWICLFICIGALLLYVGGCKKAGKHVSISFIIYVALQGMKLCLK